MAQAIKVDEGQTLKDIAIQYCGSLSALMDIAVANAISPTATIVPGTELIVPDAVNAQVVNYFSNKNFVPVTRRDMGTVLPPEGIGYWYIGIDNIVQ